MGERSERDDKGEGGGGGTKGHCIWDRQPRADTMKGVKSSRGQVLVDIKVIPKGHFKPYPHLNVEVQKLFLMRHLKVRNLTPCIH